MMVKWLSPVLEHTSIMLCASRDFPSRLQPGRMVPPYRLMPICTSLENTHVELFKSKLFCYKVKMNLPPQSWTITERLWLEVPSIELRRFPFRILSRSFGEKSEAARQNPASVWARLRGTYSVQSCKRHHHSRNWVRVDVIFFIYF